MKGNWFATVLLVCLLCLQGCTGGEDSWQKIDALRQAYLDDPAWAGQAEIIAGDGDRVYTFTVDFVKSTAGDICLTLLAPETVAGIRAQVSAEETSLSYEGVILATGMEQTSKISPLEAIPLVWRDLTAGVLLSQGEENLGDVPSYRLEFSDTKNQGNVTHLIWISQETGQVLQSEILQAGVCVLRCSFTGAANSP